MSYGFLLDLSRSAIKRVILIHRWLLNSAVLHAKHQAGTAQFIHEQAERAADVAAVAKRAAYRHANAVRVAANIELESLPEYKA